MGLSSSRTRHRVTKVAPARAGGDLPLSPYVSVPHWFSHMPQEASEQEKATFPRQLPPLRETGYGRATAGPRPLSFNTMLEKGDTSIIKQHPPRRPQKLEPAGLLAAEKLLSQQDTAATPKAKALEKRGQTLKHVPGRRQHLHKLQMLDLNRRRREAELKRNLHREAKINKQKIKEFNPKKVLGNLQRSNSSESQDLTPAEHNQTFNGDCGNTWDRQFSGQHDRAESSPSKSSKVDLWFCWEQPTRDLFWDSSSTDSEDWEREGKKFYHKPTLVRTKTERIPLFNEFIFDKDL
ncbi:factor associated with metabolism and energy isoform X1 [Apteryx mantelli]|uniref:Factor associated with metabolism and energy isoform X1 n=1 Tax=Apteryx mantelli TaxID=2696672 RepID=A0ABM4EGE6_9AVES